MLQTVFVCGNADDTAPPASKSRWLATFYLCIPVGYAAGYILGGLIAPALGWRAAFLIEAAAMLPFAAFCAVGPPIDLRGKSHPTGAPQPYLPPHAWVRTQVCCGTCYQHERQTKYAGDKTCCWDGVQKQDSVQTQGHVCDLLCCQTYIRVTLESFGLRVLLC